MLKYVNQDDPKGPPNVAATSAAITSALGIDEACGQGADRVLLVPGDCPALDPDEVGALLGRATRRRRDRARPPRQRHQRAAALAAAGDRAVVRPGLLRPPRRLARAAGADVRVAELPSLGLDVDTPDDLAALRGSRSRAARGGAARTRELLARLAAAAAAAG